MLLVYGEVCDGLGIHGGLGGMRFVFVFLNSSLFFSFFHFLLSTLLWLIKSGFKGGGWSEGKLGILGGKRNGDFSLCFMSLI